MTLVLVKQVLGYGCKDLTQPRELKLRLRKEIQLCWWDHTKGVRRKKKRIPPWGNFGIHRGCYTPRFLGRVSLIEKHGSVRAYEKVDLRRCPDLGKSCNQKVLQKQFCGVNGGQFCADERVLRWGFS